MAANGKKRTAFFRLSPDDYSGLHRRYAALLGESRLTLGKNDDIDKAAREWASVIKNVEARKDAEAAARILLSHGIKLPRLMKKNSARLSGLNTAPLSARGLTASCISTKGANATTRATGKRR